VLQAASVAADAACRLLREFGGRADQKARVRAPQRFLAKVSRRSARNDLAISINSARSACQPLVSAPEKLKLNSEFESRFEFELVSGFEADRTADIAPPHSSIQTSDATFCQGDRLGDILRRIL